MSEPTTIAIVPAAGSGSRMGMKLPKQFYGLSGAPILVHTLRALSVVSELDAIVLVVPKEHFDWAQGLVAKFDLKKIYRVVEGGARRQDSVKAGLKSLPASAVLAVVHDGVRPFVSPETVAKCIEVAGGTGASMAAIPVTNTIKAVGDDNRVVETVDRERLWQAQTPQVVQTDLLKSALAEADRLGATCTDEAALLELIGTPMTVVPGSEKNIKITRPEDLLLAEAIMAQDFSLPPAQYRVGHGYDVHQLVEGRLLILGGVTIPHSKGLLGHSDADVLTHALCDAILGALGEGDIGRHFPDTDDTYKNIDSLILLEKVVSLASGKGFVLENGDITVMAEKPRLAEYISQMREQLALVCQVNPGRINCKATTTEKLGFVGREEGIGVQAIVLLKLADKNNQEES